ncbi:hypothetical protein BAE44_0004658, partial [Dichanthelium oligosanthes]
MPAEDGGIGFAGVNRSTLHFWSRETDNNVAAGWALIKIIKLKTLTISDLPAGDMLSWSSVVGFGCDIIGIDVKDVVYGIKYQKKKKQAAAQ